MIRLSCSFVSMQACIVTLFLLVVEARTRLPRNILPDGTSIAESYDFVICGGGLAGLVLGSRLSEDSNTTVLVLEAGESGDEVAADINTPAYTYYNSLTGTSYDWSYSTVSQPSLNNRVLSWPRGKVLGGSSAINGLYLIRPSELEVNLWQSLISSGDATSTNNWSWDSFFAALKKSETFNPPSSDVQAMAGIQYDTSSHGNSGPIHYSYPGYTFPIVGNWTPTLQSLGIPPITDPAGGHSGGSFIANSAINPANWTRSYSRSAYIDPLPLRSNLDILTGATVTRIIFDNTTLSNLTATAVEYASSASDEAKTVKVMREVILAGGTVGSPQILMLSGVGPKDVLGNAGVPLLSELPGVGQHLQDHLSAGVTFQSIAQTAGDIEKAGSSLAQSTEFLSFINSATAYVNLTTLLGSSQAASLQSEISASLQSSCSQVPSSSSEVVQGYQAIFNATSNSILPSEIGAVEMLLSTTSSGVVVIQAALQHPLSHGRIYITTPSVFDSPAIDPQYLSNSADLTTIREGLKLARKIGQTNPLASLVGSEITPGSSVNTDDDWESWLKGVVGTEYHPTGTCSMLPKEQGGVVDANLMVYGLANVRVADASVYPFVFSSHLGAPTYGLAEQASAIIRGYYNAGSTTTTNSTDSTQPTITTPSSALHAASFFHISWTLALVISILVQLL